MQASLSTHALAPAPLPPGPSAWSLLGSIGAVRADPLGYLMREAARYGDVVSLPLVERLTLVNHPDHVQHVLQERHAHYTKGFQYARLRPLLGDGLLTSEGEFWKRQRRLAQPAFHKQRIQGFLGAFVDHTQAMLSRWAARTAGAPLDLHAEMNALTLQIAGATLFSADLTGAASDVGRALTTAIRITNARTNALWPVPVGVPTPQNVRYRRAIRELDRVVGGIIEARRTTAERHDDLLAMLMEAEDADTRERMSDRQLRDEVMTMILAGHETTANALSWAFWLLSTHPEWERRLHAETTAALAGRAPALTDLPKLGLATRVVEEAMRLYPPAWIFSRKAMAEDEIGGYRIPAGSTVSICTYALHRHPKFWPNPEGFDPDRFLPAAVAARPRWAYVPFAGGPRQCIGNSFALLEAQVAVAMIVQRFRVELVPGQVIAPEPTVTLRPRHGVRVTLRARAPGVC